MKIFRLFVVAALIQLGMFALPVLAEPSAEKSAADQSVQTPVKKKSNGDESQTSDAKKKPKKTGPASPAPVM